MNWSPKQDEALRRVSEWLKSRSKPWFYLAGYAGTGKTTLARHFAEMQDGVVLYGAFTGKAAYVLRQKGCHGATTIHRLIYNPKEKSRAELLRLERELALAMSGDSPPVDSQIDLLKAKIAAERRSLARPAFTMNDKSDAYHADLIIVDEVSMVDSRLGEDLLSFDVPILVLGDPAQLPPVAAGGYFTSREPDYMLTEIHRQAFDNPIIAMATRVREGDVLPIGAYGTSKVISRCDVDQADVMQADQILVGRNATRRASNTRVRQLNGFETWLPEERDKLVCLRNDHDVGLLNGALWRVAGKAIYDGNDKVLLTIEPLDDQLEPLDVEAHAHHFRGDPADDMAWWERKKAQEFDYGYALTVHKSQGSQWDSVYLFDESGCFRQDASRHLYTGITRAADRITVVR